MQDKTMTTKQQLVLYVLYGAPHSMEHMLGLTTVWRETGRKPCTTRVIFIKAVSPRVYGGLNYSVVFPESLELQKPPFSGQLLGRFLSCRWEVSRLWGMRAQRCWVGRVLRGTETISTKGEQTREERAPRFSPL